MIFHYDHFTAASSVVAGSFVTVLVSDQSLLHRGELGGGRELRFRVGK